MNFVWAIQQRWQLKKICQSIGDQAVSYDTGKVWFKKFREGQFCLEDEPHPGRPSEVNIQLLEQLIENDPRQTSRGLAVELGCSHTTIEKHLHEIGKKWKYSSWLPHELTPKI